MYDTQTIKILKLLGDFVCDSQVRLSQYTFLANERHKAVRAALEKAEKRLSKEAIEELRDSISELDSYLLVKFGDAFENCYEEFAAKYFGNRSYVYPRMSIKVINLDQLVTLFRVPENFMEDEAGTISENTAFKKIAEGHRYIIFNNIPFEAAFGDYENKRIITEKVIDYMKFRSAHVPEDDENDKAWAACWKRVRYLYDLDTWQNPNPEACYKSTLVVPLSLLTHELDREFIDQFKIDQTQERAIFGFLCFDHRRTDFFQEEKDVQFVYILADILSLYLIQQLTHTQYSSIYYKAKQMVVEKKS